jgi:hypothetical protein
MADPEIIAALQAAANDARLWFIDATGRRRHPSKAELERMAASVVATFHDTMELHARRVGMDSSAYDHQQIASRVRDA